MLNKLISRHSWKCSNMNLVHGRQRSLVMSRLSAPVELSTSYTTADVVLERDTMNKILFRTDKAQLWIFPVDVLMQVAVFSTCETNFFEEKDHQLERTLYFLTELYLIRRVQESYRPHYAYYSCVCSFVCPVQDHNSKTKKTRTKKCCKRLLA